ncbi:restriction endonuclease subunit S [Streptococcus suis]|nr:hypothetical protein [Streptococcus suis]HEP1812486.1 restriction endonuclease subunit S [Streptococcus suis]
MTRMKDSGIEWIGEIPEEWGITKFKFLGTAKNGLTYSPENIVEQTEGVLVLRSGNIRNNKLVFDNNVYVNSQIEPSIFLKKGDILITARNGSANLIGKNAIVEEPILATYGAFMMVFRVNKRMKSKFAYYLMNSSFDFYRNFFTTSTVNQLTAGIFYNIEVPLPTIIEQTKIADFLDKKIAQLDKVKSLLEEQIKTLEDYRQSLIYETVTKGLDKTVPLKDSGVDWIGQIPEGWGVKSFKYAVTIKDGTHDTPEYFVEGVPLITSKNLDSIHNEIDFEGAKNISFDDHRKISQRSDVKKGDILMPMIGTVGGATQVLVEKEFSIKNVALFKVAHDEALSRFLYYQLNSSWINSQLSFMMSGGVQSFISLNMLSKVKLIIPTSEEIKKISLFLDSGVGKINQMIFIKKEQIENINKQRQTLIYDYVTGKRRV